MAASHSEDKSELVRAVKAMKAVKENAVVIKQGISLAQSKFMINEEQFRILKENYNALSETINQLTTKLLTTIKNNTPLDANFFGFLSVIQAESIALTRIMNEMIIQNKQQSQFAAATSEPAKLKLKPRSHLSGSQLMFLNGIEKLMTSVYLPEYYSFNEQEKSRFVLYFHDCQNILARINQFKSESKEISKPDYAYFTFIIEEFKKQREKILELRIAGTDEKSEAFNYPIPSFQEFLQIPKKNIDAQNETASSVKNLREITLMKAHMKRNKEPIKRDRVPDKEELTQPSPSKKPRT